MSTDATKKLVYVANWKMNMPAIQSTEWFAEHYEALSELGRTERIVICPTVPALFPLYSMILAKEQQTIMLGAQDCSVHAGGPFTGQIAAEDLKAIGAQFCILGHSESRTLLADTSITVARKCARALEHYMLPIVCIGETAQERAAGNTLEVLEGQLEPVLKILTETMAPMNFIAYEPVWAIGSGVTPTPEEIGAVLDHLKNLIPANFPGLHLLYGGSVTSKNAPELKKIALLSGFLVGNASLDFQEFKKIVEC